MRVFKVIIALALAALVVGICALFIVVKSKYAVNDFNVDLNMAFNAAMMLNGETTNTDEDKAVICEYDGRRTVLEPDNYKAVSYYLCLKSRMALFNRVDMENALALRFCGSTVLYASPDKDEDGVYLHWVTPKKTYNMHALGSELWEKLTQTCMEGTNRTPNVPLD